MKTVFIGLLCLGCVVAAVVAHPAPDTLWTRTYGDSLNEYGSAIAEAPDNGFIVVGYIPTNPFVGFQLASWKMDSIGNLQWQRTYGIGYADAVTCIPGGGYAIGGSLGQPPSNAAIDMLLIRTDEQGNELWRQTYGGPNRDQCYDMVPTSQGGYVLAGETDTDGTWSVLVVNVDSNGVLNWQRIFSWPDYHLATVVVETEDGGFFLGGRASTGALTMRLNSEGDSLWSRVYDFVVGDVLDAVQTPDGFFVSASGKLIKIDANGDTLWTRQEIWGAGDAMVLNSDAGCTLVGAGGGTGYLSRMASNGDSLWSLQIEAFGNSVIRSIVHTHDGGYAIGGSTQTPYPPFSSNVWVIRLDEDPTVCEPTELPFIENFHSPELDSCWYWRRKYSSHFSLIERPGWMRIISQEGSTSPNHRDAKNILLRTRPLTAFRIETKLVMNPAEDYQQAGLIVWQSDTAIVNLTLGRVGWPGQAIGFGGATGVTGSHFTSFVDTSVYLRLDIIDSIAIAHWSPDSLSWNSLGTVSASWLVQSNLLIGLLCMNDYDESGGGLGALEIPADFDYLSIEELPGSTVCGNASGVWDLAGSPYYVTCDIALPADSTLEIEQGVTVQFMGPYKFEVLGNLQAIGTETDSIYFTTDTLMNPDKWRGLEFVSEAVGPSHLEYCVVEYAAAIGSSHQETHGGGIYLLDSSPTISHCTIRNNTAVNAGGINCSGTSVPFISYCRIEGNSATEDVGGIAVGSDAATTTVSHCVVVSNHAAIRGGGVYSSKTVEFSNCTIVGNSADQAGGAVFHYHAPGEIVTLTNCILWNNTSPQVHIDQGDVDVFFSDFEGGYSGTGNIDEDPLFTDTDNGDFHLTSDSPCIDAGDPSSPLDPDSTIADMGAFYYPQPNLLINPDQLDFALLDLGTDSTIMISFYNPTVLPVVIDSFGNLLPEFSVDTSGLGTQFGPQSTFDIPVTFFPSASGMYRDTIVIIAEMSGDDTIRIPLAGEAAVIPLPVDSLIISMGPMNGIELNWAPVTHSISGQPLSGVSYVIYGNTVSDGDFVPFGFTPSTTYQHPFILNTQDIYFYYVEPFVEGQRALNVLLEVIGTSNTVGDWGWD